jgi:hypothetical protein
LGVLLAFPARINYQPQNHSQENESGNQCENYSGIHDLLLMHLPKPTLLIYPGVSRHTNVPRVLRELLALAKWRRVEHDRTVLKEILSLFCGPRYSDLTVENQLVWLHNIPAGLDLRFVHSDAGHEREAVSRQPFESICWLLAVGSVLAKRW